MTDGERPAAETDQSTIIFSTFMKLNSPLPQPLPKECAKAAKIFKSFVDSGNNGLDGVIPRHVLENAKGFAIFTIFKAGFLFSARAGSGVVIAKLSNGSWSAPSAIGTAGLGVGGQVGAEMTDFLIVLNTRAAIQSFMAAGSLTLGGNMSIAIGPLGRNGEALGSVSTSGKVAAMYSYSKTRGLFGGLSIEGSVIMERQDANAIAYNSPVTARLLLGGAVDPPEWASGLIQTLESCTGMPGNRQWVEDGTIDGSYVFDGVSSPGPEPSTSYLKKKKKDKSSFPPTSWGSSNDLGSYSSSTEETNQTRSRSKTWDQPNSSSSFETQFESDFNPEPQPMRHPRFSQSVSYTKSSNGLVNSPNSEPSNHFHGRSFSLANTVPRNSLSSNPFSEPPTLGEYGDDTYNPYSPPHITPKPELVKPLQPHEGIARAIALYNFRAVESGDLSFSKGDVITITQKSDSRDDWWTGKIGSRQGIFPANFVEVV
ncbi:hypothetical protein Hypma_015153 [Hypsizygus marmoreus]|uniref:SH3 domain-containing protein n=1 Tax=Hypsizygus marmoreus TaxID=39966 RepID=A0A369K890_HYPMA|nr:hypothetical protein Hypma_015153 [Hypsizygus marmoreus]